MTSNPYPGGTVDWTGENPGIYLKDDAGAFVSLASLFRVMWSPHGAGHALVLLDDPSGTRPDAVNLCLTDNPAMARWCIDHFLVHFAAFKGRSLLATLPMHALDSVTRGGDSRTEYTERVTGAGHDVTLRWGGLGAPYAVDMAPDLTATGRHRMYSLFVDSDDASITLDGRRLPGRVMPRPVAGRDSRTAFLAFSETWLLP